MSKIQPVIIKLKSGEEVWIRCAEIDDARNLIEYMTTILRNASAVTLTQAHELSVSEEDEAKWIHDHVSSPGKLILLAEQEEKIVGLLHFANGNRERNQHTGSFGMSVHKDWRKQGIGRALVQNLLDWAKMSPIIEKVCLEVFSTNIEAITLYQNLDFIEEGRCPNAYRLDEGKYVDNILMCKFTD